MPKDESQGQTYRAVVRQKKNRPFMNMKASPRNVTYKKEVNKPQGAVFHKAAYKFENGAP